jgi:hypothetical protein
MKSIFVAAASVLAFSIFGCAVETAPVDGESSTEALSAPVVGEFAHCGGSIQNAPVCGAGLKCNLGAIVDRGGICVKQDFGSHCGGYTRTPHTCDRGLECVLGPIADKGGTCDYAKAGETCGGNLATAVECGPQLLCKQTRPDVAGKCVVVAQKGEHCGGLIVNAPVCAAGLTCVLGSTADKGGTCQ